MSLRLAGRVLAGCVLAATVWLGAGCKPEPAAKKDESAASTAGAASDTPAASDESPAPTETAATETAAGAGAGSDDDAGDTAQPDPSTGTITAAGHLRRTIEPARLDNDGSCLGEKPDPCADVTPASLPVCDAPAPATALTLAQALEQRNALVDQAVVVVDTLSVSPIWCTEMACDRQCCNSCGGTIGLALPGHGSGYRSLAFGASNSAVAQAWQCSGDESGVCCNTIVPTGQVVVRGTLRSGNGNFWLDAVDVCMVAP